MSRTQEYLIEVFGTPLRMTALRAEGGLGIELVEYRRRGFQ